jgi:hypothetical protein
MILRGRSALPATIALPTDFGINNVQSGLAGEVFQVLKASVSPVNPVEMR